MAKDGADDDAPEPKDGDDGILKDALEAFALVAEHEEENRSTALADIKFALLSQQWPEDLERSRKKAGLPCLTINKMGAFTRQVVNDARQNKPAIKCHPADSKADVSTAQIYDGLIRNIEVTSKADVAYDTALEHATAGGFGYFRIGTEYACDDTFDLDLVINRIANPFSVYGDPYSTAADSSDWNTAFVVERLPKDEFERRFKNADKVDWSADGYTGLENVWVDDDEVMIAEWWRREKVKKKILLLSDNQVMAADVYEKHKELLDAIGVTVMSEREVPSHKVTQYLMTGAEVLETNEWDGKYIPLVPVYGHEINVEGKRYFRALIHDAVDAQKMFNYWRTKTTEAVALAPSAPFLGPVGSFETDKAKWETANTESHPFLEYDAKPGQQPPQRQPFAGVPAGALQEALNASDDMKAVIGMYDASLGARSNETSGKAIMARQREGDVSTFHFIDNLARGIEHAGRILIDLIPKVYTGERIVRVLGQDKAATTVQLGAPVPVMGPDGQPQQDAQGQPLSRVYDLGVGKYDLTVETGPSFTTRREEAVYAMTEMLRAAPAAVAVLMPRIAKAMDIPDSEEIGNELAQLAQAGAQGAQPDPAAMAEAQAKAQEAQARVQLDGEKLKIDQFRAETERMKVMLEMEVQRHQAMNPQPQAQPGLN